MSYYFLFLQFLSTLNSWLIPVEQIVENQYNMMPTELALEETQVTYSPHDLAKELLAKQEEMRLVVTRIEEILKSINSVKKFDIRKMSSFLDLRRDFILVEDDLEYQRITVQLHGKGVISRDKILGKLLKTKKQQLTQANDLIVAEIDAKVGGFGIIPPE